MQSFLGLRVAPSLPRLYISSVTRSFGYTYRRLKDASDTETKSNSVTSDDRGQQSGGLPPLSRPLGVRERPTILKKTKTQRIKELMDHDARIEQRRHLIKEASTGYFHDLNMTRRHGGKTWIAPKVLIREDKALYLPNVSGKSLDEGVTKNTTTMCFGRITILSMLGTKISELNAKSFVNPTHERYSSHPLYQHVQINLQENLLKSFLVNLFLSSLRSSVSKELQSNYLISSQNLEYIREALGMTNTRVGYVFLIDENLKIRWGGCADPTVEEIQSLENCTGVLLKRLEKKPKIPTRTEGSKQNSP